MGRLSLAIAVGLLWTVSALAQPFVDNGDGTVTDTQTGLQWEKKTGTPGGFVDCSMTTCTDPHDVSNSYQWSQSGSAADGGAFTDFLAKLNSGACFAGHCDWRLPTLDELQSLLLAPYPCGTSPCIDPIFGPTQADLHWSSTTDANIPSFAWFVYFNNGFATSAGKVNTRYVRAVRTPSIPIPGISGKKLLLRNPPKFILFSKDPSISVTNSDPVGGADSSLTFDDGNGPVTLSLPALLWYRNGSGTTLKYRNVNAPSGPSIVKSIKLRSGLLKVIGKGLPVAVPTGPATVDVVLSLDGGAATYCMTFTGTGDGRKFRVKDAPADVCPPSAPTATPTSTVTGAPAPTSTPTSTSAAAATNTPTATICTNDCSPNGSSQCVGNTRQTCGNYDADSCLEWGGNTTCTYACSGGICCGDVGQNCCSGTTCNTGLACSSGTCQSNGCPPGIDPGAGKSCLVVVPYNESISTQPVPPSQPLWLATAPLQTAITIDPSTFSASAGVSPSCPAGASGCLVVSKTLIGPVPLGNFGTGMYIGSIGSGRTMVRFNCSPGDAFECNNSSPVSCTGGWQVFDFTNPNTNMSCGFGKHSGTSYVDVVVLTN